MTLEEKTASWARQRAARQNMSLSRYLAGILDAQMRESREYQRAMQAGRWIERLWHEQSGRTSMQVLSELYVTLTRKLRPGMRAAEAWEEVEALLAWNPLPVDRSLLHQARAVEQRHRPTSPPPRQAASPGVA